jgi:ATP/maltotriose-dependent transcriptional regulator MalT
MDQGSIAQGHLERAREACRVNAWRDAYDAYREADTAGSLAGDDLDRLALAACLVGSDSEFLAYKERAYRAHVAANCMEPAARDAFWLSLVLLLSREFAQANAWAARGERLVCECAAECVERGYLQLPLIEQVLRAGDFAAAYDMAAAAVALGERKGEADLIASARHMQGRAAIKLGEVSQGIKLLDETMLAVVSGELSPIITGLMYCSVIDACRGIHELRRAREWTAALSHWCDRQAGMVAFTDACFVHRAEILCLQGAWQDALAETRRVCARAEDCARPPPGGALYQRGEIHRLRGEASEAEEFYRAASRCGCDPQPGLALLRVSQGRTDAASAAIRRSMGATGNRCERARLLPAYFEIVLAAGDIEEAQRACEEIESVGAEFESEVLHAQAAQARGSLCMRCGDPRAALGPLRTAFEFWRRFEAPYEAARVRVLIAEACAALGDEETSAMEFDAARLDFEQLGAGPDIEKLDRRRAGRPAAGSLTSREREVLGLIARGQTNKGIARELGLSERTIDRHVGNILGKLNVPSRAAATAYAYSHRIL